MSAVDRLIREVKREVRSMCVEINGKLEDAILVSDFDRIADDYTERPKKAISKFRKSKPCAPKVNLGGLIVYSDGREKCDDSRAGREVYRDRTWRMYQRQNGICALSGKQMTWPAKGAQLIASDATFDHQDGRGSGGGHRDDRIEKDGKPYNAAVRLDENMAKGSMRIPYKFQVSSKDGTQ